MRSNQEHHHFGVEATDPTYGQERWTFGHTMPSFPWIMICRSSCLLLQFLNTPCLRISFWAGMEGSWYKDPRNGIRLGRIMYNLLIQRFRGMIAHRTRVASWIMQLHRLVQSSQMLRITKRHWNIDSSCPLKPATPGGSAGLARVARAEPVPHVDLHRSRVKRLWYDSFASLLQRLLTTWWTKHYYLLPSSKDTYSSIPRGIRMRQPRWLFRSRDGSRCRRKPLQNGIPSRHWGNCVVYWLAHREIGSTPKWSLET